MATMVPTQTHLAWYLLTVQLTATILEVLAPSPSQNPRKTEEKRKFLENIKLWGSPQVPLECPSRTQNSTRIALLQFAALLGRATDLLRPRWGESQVDT